VAKLNYEHSASRSIAHKFRTLLFKSLYSNSFSFLLTLLMTLVRKIVLKTPLQTEIKGLCYLHGGTQSRHEH